MTRIVGDLEDTVADRDPEAIKRDIDVARDQLAATVDSSPSGRTRVASPTTSRPG